jgi:hypothetical protein
MKGFLGFQQLVFFLSQKAAPPRTNAVTNIRIYSIVGGKVKVAWVLDVPDPGLVGEGVCHADPSEGAFGWSGLGLEVAEIPSPTTIVLVAVALYPALLYIVKETAYVPGFE